MQLTVRCPYSPTRMSFAVLLHALQLSYSVPSSNPYLPTASPIPTIHPSRTPPDNQAGSAYSNRIIETMAIDFYTALSYPSYTLRGSHPRSAAMPIPTHPIPADSPEAHTPSIPKHAAPSSHSKCEPEASPSTLPMAPSRVRPPDLFRTCKRPGMQIRLKPRGSATKFPRKCVKERRSQTLE